MNSREIVRNIVAKIIDGTLSKNIKLYSENQLAIKYNVSRTMITKAYEQLRKIGAIYSIPKKGFYVAENFNGIIRSMNSLLSIDRVVSCRLKKYDFNVTEFSNKSFKFIQLKHYKKNKLIAVSFNWIDKKIATAELLRNPNLMDELIFSNIFKNSTNKLRFERVPLFNKENNLVINRIHYGSEDVVMIQKIIIKDKYFVFSKSEWAI